jgi:hypothetical protein
MCKICRLIYILLLLPIFSFAQTRQSGGISFTPQWNYKISGSDTTWQFGNTLMSPQQFPFILTKWESDQRYAPITGGGYVPTSRLVSTGIGLLGGGNLGSNLTLYVDTANITSKTYFNTGIGTATAASIATKGNGTVTSITPGYGFTSLIPITTTGAIAIDTTKLQTVTGLRDNTATMYRKTLVSPIANSLTITGTTGAYYINLGATPSLPSTPSGGLNLFSRSTNRLSIVGTNGFEALIGTNIFTAGHLLTLPDVNGIFMTNPLTTTGDIPYLSASSSTGTNVTRLGIGSTNNVLMVSGGVPVWSAITPSNTDTTSTGFATRLLINNYLTRAGLSATSPISYNNITGVISSQAASFTQNGYTTNGAQNIGGAKTYNDLQLLNDSTNSTVTYTIRNNHAGASASSRYFAKAYDPSGNNAHYAAFGVISYAATGDPISTDLAGKGFVQFGGNTLGAVTFFDGVGSYVISAQKPLSTGQRFSPDFVLRNASYSYSRPSEGIGMGTYRPNIARVDSFSRALTIQATGSRAILELVDSTFTNGSVVGSIYGYAGHAVANTISQIDMVGTNSNTGTTKFYNYNSGTKTNYLTGLANGTISIGAFKASTSADSIATINGGILGRIPSSSFVKPADSYYIGTTSNAFNRVSGSQTLTGVSIDGNSATVTGGTYNSGFTTNYLQKATGANTLGNSLLYDNGTVAFLGGTTATLTGNNELLNIQGSVAGEFYGQSIWNKSTATNARTWRSISNGAGNTVSEILYSHTNASSPDRYIVYNPVGDVQILAGGNLGLTVNTDGSTTSGGASSATSFKPTATQTTVSGSTSGSIVCSQPFQGSSYKKVLIYLNALIGTATYTFPTGFTQSPAYSILGSGVTGSLNTQTVTTTSVTLGTGAVAVTGWYYIEGY